MAAKPASTPTVAIARVLRTLGLTQGKGCDFRVTGEYRNGERVGTYVLAVTRHADEVIAEHADEIERLTAETGFPFRVSVRYFGKERPVVSVANYGDRIRETPPATDEEPAEPQTPEQPKLHAATLARLWADDHRAPVCAPLRDMMRSRECDKYGRPTAAAFERIAADLNALPTRAAALARLWADDHRAPVCAPMRDMIRGDECDDDGHPMPAAFTRIAAELDALARADAAGEPEHDEPRALEAAPGTAPAEDLTAPRLHRYQAEALGWSTGQAELVAAAAAGQLYRDFGAILRVVPVPGHPGHTVALHRLAPLVDAGFLALAEPDSTGRRAVHVTVDGRHALAVWKRWRPQPVEKTTAQEHERLRPLLRGEQARRLAEQARKEDRQRRRASAEMRAAVRRLHAWEEREDRLWAAWARVHGIRYRFQKRPVGWVPSKEEIAEHSLDPQVVAELRADAENPQPKPELPHRRPAEREELPPLEADDRTPEQLSLLSL